MGQRFRLNSTYDISNYTPHQQVILRAMKKYGMILADNNGDKRIWALSAVEDSRWDFDFTTFAEIQGSDFEAVDASSLMIDKDSGKARITLEVTPAPSITDGQSDVPESGSGAMAITTACFSIIAICVYRVFVKE